MSITATTPHRRRARASTVIVNMLRPVRMTEWSVRAMTVPVGAQMAVEHGPSARNADTVWILSTWGVVLLVSLLLVLLFLLGSYVLVRASRRVRSAILRRPAPPTPADDLWAAHKLPGDTEED